MSLYNLSLALHSIHLAEWDRFVSPGFLSKDHHHSQLVNAPLERSGITDVRRGTVDQAFTEEGGERERAGEGGVNGTKRKSVEESVKEKEWDELRDKERYKISKCAVCTFVKTDG